MRAPPVVGGLVDLDAILVQQQGDRVGLAAQRSHPERREAAAREQVDDAPPRLDERLHRRDAAALGRVEEGRRAVGRARVHNLVELVALLDARIQHYVDALGVALLARREEQRDLQRPRVGVVLRREV